MMSILLVYRKPGESLGHSIFLRWGGGGGCQTNWNSHFSSLLTLFPMNLVGVLCKVFSSLRIDTRYQDGALCLDNPFMTMVFVMVYLNYCKKLNVSL